jgi:low temperature requirement protein LtrA
VLIADFGLGEALLTVLAVFFFVVWVWILITILTDLFRDHRTSGVEKAIWVFFLVFLPFLTALVYLIVRGEGMRERAGVVIDRVGQLHELREKGAISDQEYERMKAKLIGE